MDAWGAADTVDGKPPSARDLKHRRENSEFLARVETFSINKMKFLNESFSFRQIILALSMIRPTDVQSHFLELHFLQIDLHLMRLVFAGEEASFGGNFEELKNNCFVGVFYNF